MYVDTNNTIYMANRDTGQILTCPNNNIDPNIVLYSNLLGIRSIFVTSNGNIYADNGNSVNVFVKSVSYSNISISVMNISSSCMGLFVDITNSLYCSIDVRHQVFKKWLNDNTSLGTGIAGTGSQGSASNLLNNPNGIFVDTNFDLYVADYWNHRIQLFRLGQSNGITVAGNTSLNLTISLYCPSNVILDRNKYLFISDSRNNRIIGSDENGFRCIIRCSGGSNTRSIAFDSFGNLYVVDQGNNRIQKFTLLSNPIETTVQTPITSVSPINISSTKF